MRNAYIVLLCAGMVACQEKPAVETDDGRMLDLVAPNAILTSSKGVGRASLTAHGGVVNTDATQMRFDTATVEFNKRPDSVALRLTAEQGIYDMQHRRLVLSRRVLVTAGGRSAAAASLRYDVDSDMVSVESLVVDPASKGRSVSMTPHALRRLLQPR